MFSTENTLKVTKAAIAQMTGKGYIDVETGELTELDDHFIVDLGEKLSMNEDGEVTNGSPADIFFKALLGQVGKLIVDTRSYVAALPNLYVDPINWGIIAEFVKIDLSDVMIDEMWNPNGFVNWSVNESTKGEGLTGPEEGARIAAIEFGCYKPPVHVKLYKQAKGIMVALTMAYSQLFTAFRGLDEYNSFIAGLYNSVENTLQLKAEVYALMTVSMGIAKARAHNNEINLLTEYKKVYPSSSIKAETALHDSDFLRFALMRIADVKDNTRRFTSLYNNHESLTFSPEPQLILLNKFANAAKFNLRANTYNEKLLGIGDYDTVNAWQAAISGSDSSAFNFETASTISLSQDAATEAGIASPEMNKTIKGVIGVLYDRYAMGITIDKRKTTSQYAASRDTTNFFYHSLVNYIVNDNYPIVSFIIADAEG